MASKQLGRLRQWAGEVISSREKPSVNEEFKDLEKDIELREKGVQRLIVASTAYQHALSKKKANDALADEEKALPIDTLGLVMIVHGEEFPRESVFGSALFKLGRAHCKIATLQEAYALTFKDTFLASMDRFKEDIKEYELLKKKVENRRVISEAAALKFDKLQNSKKEKDRREAEDEMDRAKQRFEEASEDLRAHMHAIQENERNQLDDLTSFLDLETNFVQSYLDVLKDIKSDWPDRPEPKRSINGDSNIFLATPRPSSKASVRRARGNSIVKPADPSEDDSDSPTPGKPYPNRHGRSGSTSSRPPSRPTSRLSRKRTDSSAAMTVPVSDEKDKDKDKDKEPTPERPRRKSVTGWASSAVESVTGSKSKKSKDKDSFATLDDKDAAAASTQPGEFGTNGPVRKSTSFRSLGRRASNKSKENLSANSLSAATPKILKPPSLQDKKVVRALYDFSGSSDELSFKAGNDIVVVNEVLDDWWMGELNGQRGLFPMSYTEVVGAKTPGGRSHNAKKLDIDDDQEHDHDHDHDHYITTDAEEEQIIRAVPMAINRSPIFYGGFEDKASFTDSQAEDDDLDVHPPPRRPFHDDGDSQWLATPTIPAAVPPPPRRAILRSLDPAQQPLINRSLSDNPALSSKNPTSSSTTTTPTKKIPPPPPPRRTISANPSSSPPAIPERKAPLMFSLSSSSLSVSSASGHGHGQEYDRSPFESSVDLEISTMPCDHFRQNPFKLKGMCSNCLEFHH